MRRSKFSRKIEKFMVKYVIYFCADEIAALIRAVWRYPMKVRYDKLWRLMKDNKMKKSDLSKAAEISSYPRRKCCAASEEL